MHSYRLLACCLSLYSLIFMPSEALAKQPDRDTLVKRGWVLEIYTSGISTENMPECLKSLPKSDLEIRHFAKIQYRYVRRMLITIAEIEDGSQLKLGDEVQLALEDCERGKFSRIMHPTMHKEVALPAAGDSQAGRVPAYAESK